VLEQRLHHLFEARLDALRTSDRQRPRPPRELRVEQEEGQAGEMIAVEMGDEDEIDLVAIDLQPLQRRQGLRAAIDQEIRRAPRDVEAGVEPAT
jgi:hypothetical protein